MKYLLRHSTRYQYSGPASLSQNEARILPRVLPWQECNNSQLEISPRPDRMRERTDFFGNRVVYFSIESLHDSLDVSVSSEIITHPRPLADIFSGIAWEQAVLELRQDPRQTNRDCLDARLYVLSSPFVYQVASWPSLPAAASRQAVT
ncbi:transglutaminase N-terminal domain-containing protein [Halopseudomonas pachastrellae]|nr:transglutaminase N-terminal domain-containing protein [Halopseudomonas pachastrellae]